MVWAAICLTAPGFAQAPSPPPTSIIEGIVVRADNSDPVPDARILLRKDGSVRSESDYGTRTGSDGKFILRDIGPGRYRLTAKQPGYIDALYGQPRPTRPGGILDLSNASTVKNVVLKMTPGSVVSGRVYDDAGHPLEKVNIQLIQRRYEVDGRIAARTISDDVTTNDLGEYRIYWVPPGNYYVAATFVSRSLVQRDDAVLSEEFQGAETIFPSTYYPNAVDESHAASITVGPGQDVRGIDITINRMKAGRIRGQIVDESGGQPIAGARVYVRRKHESWMDVGELGISAVSNANGEFDVRRVRQGTNIVESSMTLPGMRQVTGRAEVQVADRDIVDLRILLQTSPVVRGKVLSDTVIPKNLIFDIRQPTQNGGYRTSVTADGSFALPGATADMYRVSILGLPDNFCVVSAFSGSRDALREGIDLSNGAPDPLEIRIAAVAGVVDGTATDDHAAPVAGATVALIPASDRAARLDLFKTATADQSGRFAFRGVPPGEYKLFAWSDIEPGSYFDPAILEPYESRGTAIHVGNNDSVTKSLTVIP